MSEEDGIAQAGRGTSSSHLQAWLPCPIATSQALDHRITEWLGWKRPPCSIPGMPCPTPAGMGSICCCRSRARGRCLDRHEGHSNDRSRVKGEGGAESSAALRQQQQHRVSSCVPQPAPHAHHMHWSHWGRAGGHAPQTGSTDRQTDRHVHAAVEGLHRQV